ALDLLAQLGAVVHVELRLVAPIEVAEDMHLHPLVLAERVQEPAEQLEAVALAVDGPEHDQLSLLLAQRLDQHSPELAEADLVGRLRVDDDRRVRMPVEEIEQLQPTVP